MPDLTTDSIIPYEFNGVVWALPNLANVTTTENASVAELFEIINRNLLVLTNQRDCFVSDPPTISIVKAHHNLFVRLINFIDARTKADNEPRLDFIHITSIKRMFKRYPVRYYDQQNRFTRRWTELFLLGLSNIAQMAEANTWSNDWGINSAREMKKPFQEAYRLMCVELFGIPTENFSQNSGIIKPQFYLSEENFTNYAPSSLIPVFESLDQAYANFFTEDALRAVSEVKVDPSEEVIKSQQETAVNGAIIQ